MKYPVFILSLVLFACGGDKNQYDASGTFEAVETIVSAEASGVLREFNIEEGQDIATHQLIGYIDSTQVYLRKKQIEAQINAVLSKRPNISVQLASLQEQYRQAEREQQRMASLLKADAATQKQLDDATTQVAVIKKQIEGQESALGITTQSITEESSPLSVQVAQLNDQLEKCKIINASAGTVLTKYAEKNEMTAVGKPLYSIADLSTITLRAYVTGDQLSSLKLNQHVSIAVDATKGTSKQYSGNVEWISNKAEFTPKTIQTRDERANLVYAIKIRIKNDGFLKIGMYADVNFSDNKTAVK